MVDKRNGIFFKFKLIHILYQKPHCLFYIALNFFFVKLCNACDHNTPSLLKTIVKEN